MPNEPFGNWTLQGAFFTIVSAENQASYFAMPLGDQHNRAAFSCGVAELDRYFQGDPIRQDVSRNTANAFVFTADGISVAGFYTLSLKSILSVDLPSSLAK